MNVTRLIMLCSLCCGLLAWTPASVATPSAPQPETDGIAIGFRLNLKGELPKFTGACPTEAIFCGEWFTFIVEVVGRGLPEGVPREQILCAGPRGVSYPRGQTPIPCRSGDTYSFQYTEFVGFTKGQTIRYRFLHYSGPFILHDDQPAPPAVPPTERGPGGSVTLTENLDFIVDYVYGATNPGWQHPGLPGLPNTGGGGGGAAEVAPHPGSHAPTVTGWRCLRVIGDRASARSGSSLAVC